MASEAAAWLKPGQVFVDVNSAAPATKQRAAKAIEASGADYVEAAVMAPVLIPVTTLKSGREPSRDHPFSRPAP